MKNLKYLILSIIGFIAFSCSDEVSEIPQAGNPVLEMENQFSDVHFGDVLSFTATVSDDLSLSTLTAILYFGEEEVKRTTIRTKENGEYSGTISVPFYKDIPDGTATLEFVLLNTTMKSVKKTFDVPITRAQYPYLILVTENGSYPMLPFGEPNEYAATEAFPSTDLPAYIKTPVVDEKGTEIVFGWEAGEITQGVSGNIPFVSPVGGTFSVTFNTKTYEAAPFFEILFNGQKMNMVDKENFELDVDLTQKQEIKIEGLDDIADWWIDADYFTEKETGLYEFVPITGKYRISANLKLKYFRVEVLDGNSTAVLNEDGTGAVWIIGDNLGKPSLTDNYLGWNTDKALCMSPVGDKKYQLTVVGGETISTDAINFKFFHQKGWGGEFGSDAITTESDIVFIGDGDNGRDSGNLGLVPDVTLETGATYVFTVDVSAGNKKAVLTVVKK
ncbi:protein of unknown function [Mariniphaga anaerophila]|uniref:DUF5125 domain-containing protein n=1 Tax=Mariniphaga anaerophila TaxID=1484053 RepID=A0A1M5EW47_9BACT|nr:DUF5125 domain-containing protein [Mariniphaga anaerophila]SHF83438.1 protein of unknown function [Mariniphaga anaerophila]